MDIEALDIDLIVREVVRQIQARTRVSPDTSLTDKLLLEAKVITLAELDGKLQDVRQVVIADRAILTPAARDELNDKDIEIVRG